jgi:hypothetical protein
MLRRPKGRSLPRLIQPNPRHHPQRPSLLARDVAIRLRDNSPIFPEVYKGRDDRPGHGSGREPESNGDGEPFSMEPEIRNDSAPQHNAVDSTA